MSARLPAGFAGRVQSVDTFGHACRESATRWQHAGETVPADMRSRHQQGAHNLLRGCAGNMHHPREQRTSSCGSQEGQGAVKLADFTPMSHICPVAKEKEYMSCTCRRMVQRLLMTRRMVTRQAVVVRQSQALGALLEQVGHLVPLLQRLDLRQASFAQPASWLFAQHPHVP